mgnify:CR=1 FL=1
MRTTTHKARLPIRRIRYIDESIQLWLLVALVTMEIVLVVSSLTILHFRLDAVIEDSLYRVHLAAQPPMLQLLVTATLHVLGWTLLWNIVALVAADHIWVRHIRAITIPFQALVTRMAALEFDQEDGMSDQHRVSILAKAWFFSEKWRLDDLRNTLHELDAASDMTLAGDRERSLELLRHMRQQLPPSA